MNHPAGWALVMCCAERNCPSCCGAPSPCWRDRTRPPRCGASRHWRAPWAIGLPPGGGAWAGRNGCRAWPAACGAGIRTTAVDLASIRRPRVAAHPGRAGLAAPERRGRAAQRARRQCGPAVAGLLAALGGRGGAGMASAAGHLASRGSRRPARRRPAAPPRRWRRWSQAGCSSSMPACRRACWRWPWPGPGPFLRSGRRHGPGATAGSWSTAPAPSCSRPRWLQACQWLPWRWSWPGSRPCPRAGRAADAAGDGAPGRAAAAAAGRPVPRCLGAAAGRYAVGPGLGAPADGAALQFHGAGAGLAQLRPPLRMVGLSPWVAGAARSGGM